MRQIASARLMMAGGKGLHATAIALGVRSSDLDRMLWVYIDTDVHAVLQQTDRPPPMF